jgi:hypothetical protein
MNATIEIDGLRKRFGPVQALRLRQEPRVRWDKGLRF